MRDGFVRLGDVCTISGGYTPKPSQLFPEGDIPYFKVADMNRIGNEISLCYTDQYLKEARKVFPKGAIVFPKNGGAVATNKKRILAHDAVVDLNTGIAIPRERVDNQYLFYYFQGIDFKCFIKEGTLPVLRTKEIANLPFYFPSLPEQQRIVDILDREFAKIDALKANAEKSLQAAKDLFQATLKKGLEPKEGWSVAEIGSVCLKTDNIKWRDIPEDKEYTYIDLTSVDRSTKSVVEPQRIKKSNAPSRAQRLVCEDDIVFATTRPTLRRYCIITEQYDGQICSTGFCVLRPDKRKVRPSWLFLCLSTDAFYDYVEPLQTGATYPAITDKDVKGYTISLPTITEQDDIVSRLNDLNDKSNTLQENYQKTLTLCDDLKLSLLRKAFNGEL